MADMRDRLIELLRGSRKKYLNLLEFEKGAKAIESLKDGDKVLILESCTHHAIEDDIGKFKITKI